jgi:hypothetical protein
VTPAKPRLVTRPESGTSPPHRPTTPLVDDTQIAPPCDQSLLTGQRHAENPLSTPPSPSPFGTSTPAAIPQLESSARTNLAFPSLHNESQMPLQRSTNQPATKAPRRVPAHRISPHRPFNAATLRDHAFGSLDTRTARGPHLCGDARARKRKYKKTGTGVGGALS